MELYLLCSICSSQANNCVMIKSHSSRQASTDALCCRLVIQDEKYATKVEERSGSHGQLSSRGKGEAVEAIEGAAETRSGVDYLGEEAAATHQTKLVDDGKRRWLLDHGARADTSPALPRYPVPTEGNALASGESATEAPANVLTVHHSQEEVSAIRIQAAVRGRLARKHAAAVKQESHSLSASAVGRPLEEPAVEASAIKIQAAVRGRLARKAAAALKQEGHSLSASAAGKPLEESAMEASSIKIQAAVRGRLARKHAAAVKQEAHSLSASAVGKLLNESAEEASAIKIQAAVRGRLARKHAAALKQPGTEVPANKVGGPLPETASMVGIQAAVRGMSARSPVAAVKQGEGHSLNPAAVEKRVETLLEEASAIKIQAAVRGRLARRSAAVLKQPHPELAAEAAVDHAAEEASAIKIQAAFRGRLARKSARAVMQHNATVCINNAEQASAVKIQAVVRGCLARKSMAAMRTATAVAEQLLQTSLRRTSTGGCAIPRGCEGSHLPALSWWQLL